MTVGLSMRLAFLGAISICTGFKVTQYSQVPEQQEFRTGERLYLLCKSDTAWERCAFRHRAPGSRGADQFCHQEWKRATGSVEFTTCPMKSRVRKVGKYDKKECGIEINRLQLKDAGTWECEMEEYKWGDWSSGPKHQHHFEAITVRNRFTPSVIVPKETKEEKEVEEEEVVEEEEEEKEEEIAEEEENNDIEPVVHHEEEEEDPTSEEGRIPELRIPPSEEASLEDDFQIYNETEFVISSGNSTDQVMWHQNLEAGESAGSSVGPIVGGVIAAIALVASLVVGAFLWTRKKKSLAVISMSKLRESDDRSQANAFIEEAEYNTTMPGGGGEEC